MINQNYREMTELDYKLLKICQTAPYHMTVCGLKRMIFRKNAVGRIEHYFSWRLYNECGISLRKVGIKE